MNLIDKFKSFKSFFSEPLFFYYNIFRSINSLQIEDFDEEDYKSIIINNYNEKLYCLSLAGAGENVQFLNNNIIDSLCSEFKNSENGEFTWVLVKNGMYKRSLIFTQNKDIAIVFEKNMKATLLDFEEISNVLLSLFFDNEYVIDNVNKTLEQKYKINLDEEYKNPINLYNNMIINRTLQNFKQNKYYQAISYKYDKNEKEFFDVFDFFKQKFSGALFTKFVFNIKKMQNELSFQKSNTTAQFHNRDKKIINKLKKDIESGERILINSTLLVNDDYGSNVAKSIEKNAFCVFDRIVRSQYNLASKTPLFAENKNFSRVVDRSFMYNYICSNVKLDSDQADLVGTSIDNSFMNFGFKKATKNNNIPKSHTILLGTSGAGKTITANEIFRQLIDYDVKKKEVNDLIKTNHVIFDIKDSFYNQVKSIYNINSEYVDMQDFNKNDFLYNIVDCDIIKRGKNFVPVESDLSFAATIISMILQAGNGEEYLLTSEEEEFKDVLKELYTYNTYDYMSIGYIATTHVKEYEELLKLGYDDFTMLNDVKESKFDKFKKPLLFNVINVLKERETKYLLENRDMKNKIVESLIFKLETIEQMQIFSSFSKLDFDNKPIIYFKTDDLLDGGAEEYGYFVFAMLSIIVKKDKKEQHAKRIAGVDRPMIYFWFEEARNIFSNKLFKEKEVFERVINEWRSYDLLFFPITQEPQHIPDTILNGFEIKMLLVSGEDEEEKADLLENLSTRLSIGKSRKAMIERLPKYTMFVMYGDGAFSIKFNISEDFINLVNT